MLLIKLIFKNIKTNLGLGIMSIITIFVVIFSVNIIDYIYNNIKNLWIEETIGKDKNKIIITKKYNGFIKNMLSNNDLEKIYKNLSGEKYAFYNTKIPASANINFMGLDFNTDIFIYATDKFTSSGDKIDLGISTSILNLYNTQVATDSFFPKLDKNSLTKINIEILFGKNSFFNIKNYITKNATIKYIDSEFPLLGFTIAKNEVDKITEKLKIPKAKIYKIIFFPQNINIVENLKKQYPNLNIQGYNDIEKKINNKLKTIRYIFNGIKTIIYIILFSFIVVLSILLIYKNKNNIKVFYYHGANKFQQFSIIFYEFSIYFLLASIFAIIVSFGVNTQIKNINKAIENKGIINVKIQKISIQNNFKNIVFLYIIFLLINLGVFLKNTRYYK